MDKKIIGIAYRIADDPNKDNHERLYVAKEFINILDEIDVISILITTEINLDYYARVCDALLLPGSYSNVLPKYYHDKKMKHINYGKNEYNFDKKIISAFHKQNKAILGICAGLQELNVYFGGSLNQEVKNHCHNDYHNITIHKNTNLYDCYKKEKMKINSLHYQGIKDLASGFKISAISDDGIIEAIEKDNIIALQWHPELMNDKKIFRYFIDNIV